ncbi:hypothetical protein BXZ70DRAFT_911155 [Cristinia sonorae]|uniref:Uncharacterized protein n=1 Tax=Cristinia sonorae TaxID=1940300 RepID=A0A8K0UFZ0_9AGAR|nr:hypothetical protein BXZ70DRAFT_911155 [Cristinia sonorae]
MVCASSALRQRQAERQAAMLVASGRTGWNMGGPLLVNPQTLRLRRTMCTLRLRGGAGHDGQDLPVIRKMLVPPRPPARHRRIRVTGLARIYGRTIRNHMATNAWNHNRVLDGNMDRANYCIQYVSEHACTRIKKSLHDLSSRSSTSAAEHETAFDKSVKLMTSAPIRAESGIWVDRYGEPLLLYASKHKSEQYNKVYDDGIPREDVAEFQANMQQMFHEYPKPIKPGRDALRHPKDNEVAHMEYFLQSDKHSYFPRTEAKGICHDYEVWQELGHADKPLRASSDLRGMASSLPKKQRAEFLARGRLLYADGRITDLIECYVMLGFPKLYPKLKVSFERGHWVEEELGHTAAGGVFLGRVTLYKLQTQLHRDVGDVLCAIFCAGAFEGGEAIFPDLNLKLQ